jgi:tape measure domain-containing protein
MLSLSVRDADVVRRELEKMGTAGEAALKRLDDAAKRTAQRGGLGAVATTAGEVSRSLEGMAGRLGPLGAGLSALGTGGAAAAAGIAAIGVAAVAAVRAGDELTQTLARISNATGGLQSAVAVYDQLYRLSLQTGVAITESAAAFTRFSVAASEIGATSGQVMQLVRGLQQAGVVSGSTVQETAAATMQLGQALASGVLQGDELRSLLENMPVLAQLLARELGVGVGELRKMGAEGELTASRVMPALLRATEQIREQFEAMPPSLARGFSAVSTATGRFLGELDQALGTSRAIAERLVGAANLIDRLRRSAGLGNAEDRATQAADTAQGRVDRLRAEIANPRGFGPGEDTSAHVARLQRQLEREEAALRAAVEERNRIAREADEARQAEEHSAGQRRVEGERRRNAEQTRELEESLDKRARAEREYREAIERINRQRALGEGAGGLSEDRARELMREAAARRDQASGAAAAAQEAERESQRISDMTARVTERAAQEEDRARQRRETEERRELEQRQRENERTTDSITRYLADGFADSFRETGGNFRALLQSMQRLAISTPIRMAVEAIARPLVSSVVSDVSGAGGMMGLLGLSGMGGALGLGALGLGGAGASLSGLLNTTVIGASGPIGPTLSGAALGGGASVGQLLGGAGLGFGAGLLLNSLVGGKQTGGMIGSGGGALAGALIGSIVPGIGTLLGGAIGGAGGGLLGGLIGPGRARSFFNVNVGADDSGLLGITGSGAKNAGQAVDALLQQTQQEIAALNAQMSALGLRVTGSAVLGSDEADPNRASSLSAALGQFSLSASDARIQGAIGRAGGTLSSGLGAAQEAAAMIAQLDAFALSVKDAADPLSAVARQFDGLRATAERLGFGLEEVNAQQQRAIEQAREQLLRPVTGAIGGLADYALRLRVANDNTGNPLSRLSAAEQDFERTLAAARGGDANAIGRFQQSAETFRGLSREVFGTGQGFANAEGRIIEALTQIGSLGSDALTASVLASETRNQTETLVGALARLQDELKALRREVQQGANNPLTARAA